MHCFVSLRKTLHPLISTGSTQEDPSRHDGKTLDWDVKNIKKNCQSVKFSTTVCDFLPCSYILPNNSYHPLGDMSLDLKNKQIIIDMNQRERCPNFKIYKNLCRMMG